MNYAFAPGFLVAAAPVAVFGERIVQREGGRVLHVLAWPQSSASRLKLPIAVAQWPITQCFACEQYSPREAWYHHREPTEPVEESSHDVEKNAA